jgi:hypothetical protein
MLLAVRECLCHTYLLQSLNTTMHLSAAYNASKKLLRLAATGSTWQQQAALRRRLHAEAGDVEPLAYLLHA